MSPSENKVIIIIIIISIVFPHTVSQGRICAQIMLTH